jgi:acyl-CoA synthetase (AMP-forming)/AMP-acid ligase II
MTDTSFAALLGHARDAFASDTALTIRGRDSSFSQLAGRAGAIGNALREAGVRPGATCGILLSDPADAAAAFFGVLAIGAIAISINELYRPRQVEYVLRHASAQMLITSAATLAQLPREIEPRTPRLLVDDVATDAELEIAPTTPDSAAQIVYTSGSTGMPKGVVTSHAALWAGVRIVAGYLGLRRTDRIGSVLPFSFVYGFNQLTTALYVGARLVVDRSTLAAEIAANLRRESVSVLAAVPPLWQQLLAVRDFRESPIDSLRLMTCAGGKLAVPAVRELRRVQPQAQLFLMYGLTEVFRSTYLPPTFVDAHPDSMGRAIPESTVYVVTDEGRLARPGEVGELVHGGPTVSLGYLNDPEATARVFRANPFADEPKRVVYSGDLVRCDADGLLYYVARRDRMIKTLGFRVSPDEIVDVLQGSGEVADSAIVTEPDPARGERIVACVVLREGGTMDALKRFCNRELPRHMQPSRYVELREIPRNASGKHDIPVLKQQVTEAASA